MPSEQAHRQQARANWDYANRLLQPGISEPIAAQWAVTVVFYAAVHCIEAYLAPHNIHSTTHIRRWNAITDPRYAVPPGVYLSYHRLRLDSEAARYDMAEFSLQDIQQRLIGDYLATIAGFVNL